MPPHTHTSRFVCFGTTGTDRCTRQFFKSFLPNNDPQSVPLSSSHGPISGHPTGPASPKLPPPDPPPPNSQSNNRTPPFHTTPFHPGAATPLRKGQGSPLTPQHCRRASQPLANPRPATDKPRPHGSKSPRPTTHEPHNPRTGAVLPHRGLNLVPS